MSDRTEYVVGFLFDDGFVTLIEKKRPAWQAGRLNGVGGHIEAGETPADAMTREFTEEANVCIASWELCIVMTGKMWRVYFFATYGSSMRCETQTDEPLNFVHVTKLPDNVIGNLRWLIPLCLDRDIEKPIHLNDVTEPA